jgi:ABC-2 type transport system ATP-binding protein
MWDIITTLVGEGTTVLLTTQYLEEADRLADSISVIDEGNVIARGTSDELKASIGGQRVEINLVSSEDSPVAREILGRLGSSEPTVSDDGRELTVKAEDAPAALRLILAEFGSRGIRLYDAGMRRPTLDDVFLRLTGHAATEEEPADAADSGGGEQKPRGKDAGRRAEGDDESAGAPRDRSRETAGRRAS